MAASPRADTGDEHARVLALYRACLAERGRHLRDHVQARARWRVAVAGDTLVVRYFLPAGDRALVFAPRAGTRAPTDALKLPPQAHWTVTLDSEGTTAGGAWSGTFAQAGAVWLAAQKKEDAHAID